MMHKNLLPLLAIMLTGTLTYGQLGLGPTFTPDKSNPYLTDKEKENKDENELSASKIENIYAGLGYTTNIKLNTSRHIDKITVGSTVISVKYNEKDNSIDIFPAVSEGQTNMNVTINGITYVFVVHIVTDDRVMYRRTYSFPLEQAAANMPVISARPAVKPDDIDVIFFINALERTRQDTSYNTAMQSKLRVYPQDRVYNWNGCAIHLIEAAQFLKENLVILKIEWQNLTDQALYLDARQIGVSIANRELPITASSQLTSTLYPGQRDVIYLFIQGYNVNGDNDFELRLPPESKGVRRLFETNLN